MGLTLPARVSQYVVMDSTDDNTFNEARSDSENWPYSAAGSMNGRSVLT